MDFFVQSVLVFLTIIHFCNAQKAFDFNGWYPCSADTYNSILSFRAECGQLQLPFCYEGVCNNKSGKTIPVFVKRILGEASKNKSNDTSKGKNKAVWYLVGGPGISSATYDKLSKPFLNGNLKNVDLYFMDYRGTGRSSPLTCHAAQADVKYPFELEPLMYSKLLRSCFQDISFQHDHQLEAFSTTSAAHDLKNLIDTFSSHQDVYIMGFSYGTHVAQVYHLLAPHQAKGFIFDGAAPSIVQNTRFYPLSDFDKASHRAMKYFLAKCSHDTNCSSVMGQNPELKVKKLYKNLDAAQLDFNSTHMRRTMTNLLSYTVSHDRIIPVILKVKEVLENPENNSRISKFVHHISNSTTNITQMSPPYPFLLNFYGASNLHLYSLVALSELYNPRAQSQAELQALCDSYLACVGWGAIHRRSYCSLSGPDDELCTIGREDGIQHPSYLYRNDKYLTSFRMFPQSNATAIFFNGKLDPITPFSNSKEIAELWNGKTKSYTFENDGHGCSIGSRVKTTGSNGCATQIMFSFLEVDGDISKINDSCLDDLKPFQFLGNLGF